MQAGPLPVANYTATIRVHEDDDGGKSVVEWSGEFDAVGVPENDAIGAMQGVYQAGLDNLRKMLSAE